MVFFALLIIQNLMKCFGHTGACINYHEKPKNINFSSSKCPNHKRVRRRATRWAEKTCFETKIFQNDKNFSKFAEIWTEGTSSSIMLIERIFGQDYAFSRLLNAFFVYVARGEYEDFSVLVSMPKYAK